MTPPPPTSSPARHPSRPPDPEALFEIIHRHRVRYVLIGSVAALVHGVDLEPADLDIVPDTEVTNLERLVEALRDMEAQPLGPFGEWKTLENGEWKWIARQTTDQELAAWKPDVDSLATLDHLYVTRSGNFDVVPEIAGTYAGLRPRAGLRVWRGLDVRVAPISELLARLTVPRREKDRARVTALREVQRRRECDD